MWSISHPDLNLLSMFILILLARPVRLRTYFHGVAMCYVAFLFRTSKWQANFYLEPRTFGFSSRARHFEKRSDGRCSFFAVSRFAWRRDCYYRARSEFSFILYTFLEKIVPVWRGGPKIMLRE
ncbi:hypothetical protein BDW75DRAFT_178300 [Aspergillus navahoensis]